ncbi:MAG: peptide/nickel transport system ATP-binding protein [Candidatus Atribacteria bacterium]|nr:peptide/nickel transport system ATP-binding protein [Candidatus Atribacteria bacterium]
MKEVLLDIKDLQVHFRVYGGFLKVLNGTNMRVYSGEKVGLVGETGCGKTTTMKAVMRILPKPHGITPEGKIIFKNKNVLSLKTQEIERLRRNEISMIFQDPTAALNPVFTIGEQLLDVFRYSKKNDGLKGKTLKQMAVDSLRAVALPDPERILASYPIQLSGGMRQRVCIALALANQKQLLIADEPGTSLDVTIQDQILRLIHRLAEERNMAVILISHSLGVIREWTERVYVMYAGSMVEEATTPKLFSQPLHPYTQALMECVPRLTGMKTNEGIPGRIPDYFFPPTGCRFHPRCPKKMAICQEEKPPFYQIDDNHQVACYLYKGES